MSEAACLILIEDPSQHPDGAAARSAEGPRMRRVPSSGPAIPILDLGLTRGDAIFETVSVVDGVVQASRAHWARFARSARMLDLPEPDVELFQAAVLAAAEGLDALEPGEQVLVKAVVSRGVESLDPGAPAPTPLGWVLAWRAVGMRELREQGRDLVTLSRGVPLRAGDDAPWLLIGAKTLSYAVNTAAKREAQRRGADDALLTSSDGYVLEGPTWSIVLLIDGVAVSPNPAGGLLPGTTQDDLFGILEARGVRTELRDVRVEELARASSAWMTGSGIYAVPVRHLDGRALAVDEALTATLNEGLAARRR